jgi:hypothetical protein
MRIKLSKSQWEKIGNQKGWIKAQDMNSRMDSFFSPSIKLVRHKINGKVINDRWYVDTVKDLPIARQLMEEANIRTGFGVSILEQDYDKFLEVASKHGYSVETQE